MRKLKWDMLVICRLQICADKTFTIRQKEVYDIQVAAHTAAVRALKPGVPFKEVYELSCRVICEGLKGLGIMKGDPAEAVAVGAHAMLFSVRTWTHDGIGCARYGEFGRGMGRL